MITAEEASAITIEAQDKQYESDILAAQDYIKKAAENGSFECGPLFISDRLKYTLTSLGYDLTEYDKGSIPRYGYYIISW